MPHTITSPDPQVSRPTRVPRWSRAAVAAGTLLLVAWGALAFGCVYAWAYRPLIVASAIVGSTAWILAGRRVRLDVNVRGLLVCLLLVLAGALLQLVPLAPSVRQQLSPASEAYLLTTDLAYGTALAIAHGDPSTSTAIGSSRRPLSIDPASTRRGIALGSAFLLLLAGLTRYFERAGTAAVPAAIVGFGVILALVGIVQKATLGDHAYGGMLIYGFWRPEYLLSTPFGPYINKNHFAGWMLLALPLGLGYFLALTKTGFDRVRRDWRTRLLWLSSSRGGQLQLVAFAVVVMAVSLVMTLSRSGIACFAVAIAVAAVFGTKGTPLAARTGVTLALLLLLVVPVAWARIDISSRFTSRGGESVQLRKDAWGATLRIVRDFPLTGTGLNTYGKATLQYRPDRKTQHFGEAHNDYLQLASEGGLLLTIPALGALVFLVLGICQRFREQRDDTLGYWVRFGAATSLVAIGLQSLVEFSLQMPGNAVLFVVLCAVATHRAPEPQRAGAEGGRQRHHHLQ